MRRLAGRTSRRLLLLASGVVLAAATALAVPPVRVALAGSSGYDHMWQSETVLGGEIGRFAKLVTGGEVTLGYLGDEVGGTIVYDDLLGTEDPSGVHSQSGHIEIALEGDFVEPGRSAGGTFEGTAIILTRRATSLDAAIDPSIQVRSDGAQAVYAVSGHWGARFSGSDATGELIYERAELMRSSTPEAPPVGPDYFNRLGPTPPGEPQTFTAVLTGKPFDPGSGGTGGGSGGGDGAEGGSASGGSAAAPGTDGSTPGFWRYVRRGLAGGAGQRLMPVAPEEARTARALRDARPRGATRLPSSAVAIDIDLSGAYLDALNLASGLVVGEGPAGFSPLADMWEAARNAAPGRLATPVDADPIAFAAAQLAEALAGQRAEGADALASQARAIAGGNGGASLPELKAWIFTAQSVSGTEPVTVAEPVVTAVRRVRDAPVPRSGPEWDAVLAAADAAGAPRSAVAVAAFAREPSADASASPSATTVPGAVLARNGGSRTLSWTADGSRADVAPERWLAYRRADGRLFWLAGEGGPVALTDGTLRGWAFTIPRASLVSARRVGHVLAHYPTG